MEFQLKELGSTIALGTIFFFLFWLMFRIYGLKINYPEGASLISKESVIYNIIFAGLVFATGIVLEDVAKNVASQREKGKAPFMFIYNFVSVNIPFDDELRLRPLFEVNDSFSSNNCLYVKKETPLFKQLLKEPELNSYLEISGLIKSNRISKARGRNFQDSGFNFIDYLEKRVNNRPILLSNSCDTIRKPKATLWGLVFNDFSWMIGVESVVSLFNDFGEVDSAASGFMQLNDKGMLIQTAKDSVDLGNQNCKKAIKMLYYHAKNRVYSNEFHYNELMTYEVKILFMRGLLYLFEVILILSFFILYYYLLFRAILFIFRISVSRFLSKSKFYSKLETIATDLSPKISFLTITKKPVTNILILNFVFIFGLLIAIHNVSDSYKSSWYNHNLRCYGYYISDELNNVSRK